MFNYDDLENLKKLAHEDLSAAHWELAELWDLSEKWSPGLLCFWKWQLQSRKLRIDPKNPEGQDSYIRAGERNAVHQMCAASQV